MPLNTRAIYHGIRVPVVLVDGAVNCTVNYPGYSSTGGNANQVYTQQVKIGHGIGVESSEGGTSGSGDLGKVRDDGLHCLLCKAR